MRSLYTLSYLDNCAGPVINTFLDNSTIAPLKSVVDVGFGIFPLLGLMLRGGALMVFSGSSVAVVFVHILVIPITTINSLSRKCCVVADDGEMGHPYWYVLVFYLSDVCELCLRQSVRYVGSYWKWC